MEEEWDADGFEPKVVSSVQVDSKWADEDLDDDVKDNWEDEEEEEEKKDTEKQDSSAVVSSAPPKKNKKNLSKKIEEKERQESMRAPLTAEEKLAEKLKQQKLQEEADLKVACDTFGVAVGTVAGGIDSMYPSSKEDFEEFSKALTKKIQPFSSSEHFTNFAEELIRNICVNMSSADMKKIKNSIENLALEKAKMEKGDKAKKSKGKGKAKLRIEGDSAMVNEYSAYGDMEDYDDFM